MKDLDKIIDSLSVEELIGQVFCCDFHENDDIAEYEEFVKRVKPGGIFLNYVSREKVKLMTDIANKYCKVPILTVADCEWGLKPSKIEFPNAMAVSAANDAELAKEEGRITAKRLKARGIRMTLSPVVDLNINFQNPVLNIRSFSDKPEQVVKIASAFSEGALEEGMVTCPKHFPGDGMDDRNQHFMTTVNPLSKEDWMKTYGCVWKKMIDAGAPAIMAAHIALPSYEKDIDEFFGAPPAVLSKSLMTDLLKGELGFDGCIISDAMSMIGVCSRLEISKIAETFLNAGGDFILFPEKNDFNNILDAVNSGRIPMERLKDAVRRVLKLKEKSNVLEQPDASLEEYDYENELMELSQKIADKSITLVRDVDGVVPLGLKAGDKVLLLVMMELNARRDPTKHEFDALRETLEAEGIKVDVMYSPKHYDIENILDDYEAAIVCSNINPMVYHGATNRIGWNNIKLFWRGYVLKSKKLVFVSFGDPYKLYDFPYIKNYINAYSPVETSQRAVGKVLLGKIKPEGKSPVEFKGFFNREV